jgi:hypothetical protein
METLQHQQQQQQSRPALTLASQHGGDHATPPMMFITREDVFGSLDSQPQLGAIGDGRKKNSPEFDNSVGFFSPIFPFFLALWLCAAFFLA